MHQRPALPPKKQKGLDSFVIMKKADPVPESQEESSSKEEVATEQATIETTGTVVDHLTEPGWRKALEPEFKKPYFKALIDNLQDAKFKQKEVFPPEEDVFTALNLTPLKDVKVVIIGQDPYHDNNQAHGLSFSVRKGIAIPPSLRNIYKELVTDVPGFVAPKHGELTEWAQRGVLLLNATLTVQAHTANSHAKWGWQTFTDEVIKVINNQREGVVFLLWGNFAQKKGKIINRSKHDVIENGHPSPLSVKSWTGCKCFSKANNALKQRGKDEINWSISE